MLRTNTLMLLLFIPLYALLRYLPEWKKWLVSSFLLILASFCGYFTLGIEKQIARRPNIRDLLYKISKCYSTEVYTTIGARRFSSPGPGSFTAFLQGIASSNCLLYQEARNTQSTKPCNQIVCFVPNHFFHNILTSILVLPTSPVLDDLRHTVRESFPYWDPTWRGAFTIPSFLLFALNIFFIILGIYLAWKQWQLAGAAPLAIFMFYDLSNGFARTSRRTIYCSY